jgi:uncharacterized protein YecE (DUF72 family)
MKIRIGTSGYSFADWVGNFYPPGIEKGKMLDYYQKHFDTVEINSTYYRIPHPAVFHNMLKKVDDKFDFVVKAHQSITHARKDCEEPARQLREAVRPLEEAGKLVGFLLQFPWSFKKTKSNMDYLRGLKKHFPPVSIFAEFRHKSWLSDDVFELLEKEGLGYVNVDEPQLPGLLPPQSEVIGPIAYARFHGRNKKTWWSGEGSKRYDYDYSEEELGEWKELLKEMAKKAKEARLYFNNCRLGQAVKAAKMALEAYSKGGEFR